MIHLTIVVLDTKENLYLIVRLITDSLLKLLKVTAEELIGSIKTNQTIRSIVSRFPSLRSIVILQRIAVSINTNSSNTKEGFNNVHNNLLVTIQSTIILSNAGRTISIHRNLMIVQLVSSNPSSITILINNFILSVVTVSLSSLGQEDTLTEDSIDMLTGLIKILLIKLEEDINTSLRQLHTIDVLFTNIIRLFVTRTTINSIQSSLVRINSYDITASDTNITLNLSSFSTFTTLSNSHCNNRFVVLHFLKIFIFIVFIIFLIFFFCRLTGEMNHINTNMIKTLILNNQAFKILFTHNYILIVSLFSTDSLITVELSVSTGGTIVSG